MVIDGADLGRNAPAYCNSTICKYASTFEIVGSKRKEESRNGPRRKRKGAKRKVSRTYIHLGIPSSVPTVVSPLSMIACMSTSTCQLPHYSVSVCCMSKLAKSASLHGCMAAWLHGPLSANAPRRIAVVHTPPIRSPVLCTYYPSISLYIHDMPQPARRKKTSGWQAGKVFTRPSLKRSESSPQQ